MPSKKSSKVRATLVLLVLSLTAVTLLFAQRQQAALVVTPYPAASPQPPEFPAHLYSEAAHALREDNLQEARQLLDQLAAAHPGQQATARLVSGLYAYQAGETELAEQILAAVSTPGGPLEDWRLYLLARGAAAEDRGELAQTTYARLIADHPGSPLRPLAFVEAAELADDNGQERLALELVAGAREADIRGEAARQLEHLAWELGRQLDDDEAQIEAGRRLLVEAPFSAKALEAARTFRAMDDVDWDRLLSSGEVKRRAQSFLAAESATAALSTLETVPESDRDFDWHLLKANALTQASQGRDALDLLAGLAPSTRAERAALAWERALAAAEAADARSGGLSTAARRHMFSRSHEYLLEVVRLDGDADLSTEALRRLYEEFLDAGLFEAAMDSLRLLRRLDPAEDTGASHLWERGWSEYRDGNLSGAVGYWTELEDIYPDHRDAHRGRYWKARALEGLGEPARAREIFRELVASTDTSDFYGRQALAQLGEHPEAFTATAALAQPDSAPWPSEPALRRAKLLVDLGLDELATQEIELVADEASPRDRLALKALMLGRQGRLRESIVLLREAFPALGGPYQSTVPVEILRAYYPLQYEDAIRTYAVENGLPPYLVAGIIRQESAFDPRATSPVGARGLMQLMPATARDMTRKLGIPYDPSRLYDPELNVRLGARYFKEVLAGFDGNVELALAGYNGGPNRIRRMWNEEGTGARLDDFLENLWIDESRNYVKRILVLADSYRQLYPEMHG